MRHTHSLRIPPRFSSQALAQSLFDHIPVGVGSQGIIPTTPAGLEAALEMGMDWSLREGYAWAEDKARSSHHTRY